MPAINGLKEGEKLVVDLSDVYSFMHPHSWTKHFVNRFAEK